MSDKTVFPFAPGTEPINKIHNATSAAIVKSSMARIMINYIDDPVRFVEDWFGAEPDLWQADFMNSVVRNQKISVASCTGAGKTTVLAWTILWYFFTRPDCQVVLTAPNASLLNAVLWKEINKWLIQAPYLSSLIRVNESRIRHRSNPKVWFVIARTTVARAGQEGGVKQAEGLAGFHAEFMLYVVDEASGVDDANIGTAEATLTGVENKIILAGNPVRVEGRFFDVFDNPKIARHWARFQISGLPGDNTPVSYNGKQYVAKEKTLWTKSGVSRRYFEQLIEEFGENSILVQAKVFGKFPTGNMTDTGFSIEEVRNAMARHATTPVIDEDGGIAEIQIGVDCARFGDDKMVATVRQGYKEIEKIKRSKSSGPEIRDLIVNLCEVYPDKTRPEFGNRPLVVIDEAEAGGGGGVVDMFMEMQWGNVQGVSFGEAANEPERYFNRAAEMWLGVLKAWMPYMGLIPDKRTLGQLTTRRYEFVNEGNVRRLESKKSLKRRGIGSPDEADSLCLAVYEPSAPGLY